VPLPYDPADPPASPPPGCPHPLLWRLAHQLHRDHRPDADGFCVTCVPAEFLPCIGRHLAQRGFHAACGGSDDTPVG
jgi:hypothetical protein